MTPTKKATAAKSPSTKKPPREAPQRVARDDTPPAPSEPPFDPDNFSDDAPSLDPAPDNSPDPDVPRDPYVVIDTHTARVRGREVIFTVARHENYLLSRVTISGLDPGGHRARLLLFSSPATRLEREFQWGGGSYSFDLDVVPESCIAYIDGEEIRLQIDIPADDPPTT